MNTNTTTHRPAAWEMNFEYGAMYGDKNVGSAHYTHWIASRYGVPAPPVAESELGTLNLSVATNDIHEIVIGDEEISVMNMNSEVVNSAAPSENSEDEVATVSFVDALPVEDAIQEVVNPFVIAMETAVPLATETAPVEEKSSMAEETVPVVDVVAETVVKPTNKRKKASKAADTIQE